MTTPEVRMSQVMIPRAGTTATRGTDVVFLFVPAFRSATGWWLQRTSPLGVVEAGPGEDEVALFVTAADAVPNRRPLPPDALIVYGAWSAMANASVDKAQVKALFADPALLAEVSTAIRWPTDNGGMVTLYVVPQQFVEDPVIADGPPRAPR